LPCAIALNKLQLNGSYRLLLNLMRALINGIILLLITGTSLLSAFADAPEELTTHRSSFHKALLEIDIKLQTEQKALLASYLEALTRLEQEHKAEGDSSAIAAIQQEKARATGPGPQADQAEGDPELNPAHALRAVYLSSLRDIRSQRVEARSATRDIYQGLLDKMAQNFTEAGRSDDVLSVQTELAELASLTDVDVKVTVADTPDSNLVERLIELPEEMPPVDDDPFAKTSWPESMTIPAGDYRLRDAIGIGGHRKGTLIRFARGSEFSHAKGKFHVWGGRLIAEACSFSGIPFRADHTGSMYFVDSRFRDCTIREQGNWWGSGNYDSKWSFENCMIEGSLHQGSFNVNYLGLCMTRCSLSRVELPGVWYREREPASLRENKWLTVKNCRFEKCKVPLSFLSITTDCAFIDCRFEDDDSEQKFTKPFEVTFYTQDCTNTIRDASELITLIEKPLTELTVPYGSILSGE